MALDKPVRLSVSVTTDDYETLTRAAEAMNRMATGMALEGIQVIMFYAEDDGTIVVEDTSEE